MDKSTILKNFEQIGNLQKNLGLLDDIDGKSEAELATIFPRAQFNELSDDSYYSMLETMRDTVTETKILDEFEPEIPLENTSGFGKEMDELFNYSAKEKIDVGMPKNNTIDMDSPESLAYLGQLEMYDREESLYNRPMAIGEEEL